MCVNPSSTEGVDSNLYSTLCFSSHNTIKNDIEQDFFLLLKYILNEFEIWK